MIWLWVAIPILLAVIGTAYLRRSGRQDRTDAADDTDILAAMDEQDFDASVLQKLHNRSAPTMDLSEPAAPNQTDITWNESRDIYRPVEQDARRFTEGLALNGTPKYRRQEPLILIRQTALDLIQAHLRTDLTTELGGLLVGQAFYDGKLDAHFVLIEDAFSATGGAHTAISFEYTSEAWAQLTPYLLEMISTWTILGSYHSHPGLGVFLSDTDRETQETLFGQSWQLALVIDPIADTVGFFMGDKGVPCQDWFTVENRT